MSKEIILIPDKKTSSGIVTSKPCTLHAMLIGTDGVNDPIVTLYDGTDNTGIEIVPSSTYDASIFGLNGFSGIAIQCLTGLYVEITTGGAIEVVTYRRQW
jgi:hypothetical protein